MVTRKISILCINDYYMPGMKGGGPIRSIHNMVRKIGDDFDFYIVTRDRDLGDRQPYAGVSKGVWTTQAGAQIMYLPLSVDGLVRFVHVLRTTKCDLVYLNSVFSWAASILPLLILRLMRFERQIVVAPRGELLPGALELKSFKKAAFLFMARLTGLYKGVRWQATSEAEELSMRKIFGSVGKAHIFKVSNFVDDSDFVCEGDILKKSSGDPLSLCFISRIAPKKNLDFAIECLSEVEERIDFHVYGPTEDLSYWKHCEALIHSLPSNIHVIFGGSLEAHNVVKTLAQHHGFFFPTRGENFGHVILEALKAGLPVITSDQTPWTHLGQEPFFWALDLGNKQVFTSVLKNLARLRADRLLELRKQALKMAFDISQQDALTSRYNHLFKC